MTKLESAYRFLKGFVYPALLGAALAWWIQAVATWLSPATGSDPPSPWSLWFGAWFVAYDCVWYWFLLTKSKDGDKPPDGYSGLSVGTDFFDTVVLGGGFVALGFASGNYDKLNEGMAFAAVLLLIASAAVANFPRWRASTGGWRKLFTFPVPFAVVLAFPAIGAWRHFLLDSSRSMVDVILLALLYVALIAYFLAPSIFSSHRDPPSWNS